MQRVVIIVLLAVVALSVASVALLDRRDRPPIDGIGEVRETLPRRLSAKEVRAGDPVYIRIFKQEKTLEVWMKPQDRWVLFQAYDICRFSGRLGPKLREGDKQAPEGFYTVSANQLNPGSRHHLAFNLGFPNAFDRAHGRTGSYLMVHGGCTSSGCYAMTDTNVDDIYSLVNEALQNGQSSVAVHAFPFRMTPSNMARHKSSRWIAFWRDLKPAYEAFEATRSLPEVRVEDRRYVVNG